MYKIGMFSKHGKVTVKTLRHYDEAGLLTPAYIDEETGYRYYTTDQLSQLHEIIALRQMGFSIPEIRSIIDNINIDKILEQYERAYLRILEINADGFLATVGHCLASTAKQL